MRITKISSKSQVQLILNHLIDHGYITQLVASNYGVRRLAARIFELKDAGVAIDVESRYDLNDTRYAYYSLSDAERSLERIRRNKGRGYLIGSVLVAA